MDPLCVNLRSARTRARLTQAELAERARSTQAAVSRIERGLHNPTVELLARLYAAMGLQLSLHASPPAVDPLHLSAERALSMEERLTRAFAWMQFNALLHGAATEAPTTGAATTGVATTK